MIAFDWRMGDIPIPENGYIVFIGETGGKVKIN